MWKGSDTFQLLDYTTGTINYGLLYNCIFFFFFRWQDLTFRKCVVFTVYMKTLCNCWCNLYLKSSSLIYTTVFLFYFVYFILHVFFSSFVLINLPMLLGVKMIVKTNNKVWQILWTLEKTVLLHHMQDWKKKNMPQYTLLNKHGSSSSNNMNEWMNQHSLSQRMNKTVYTPSIGGLN